MRPSDPRRMIPVDPPHSHLGASRPYDEGNIVDFARSVGYSAENVRDNFHGFFATSPVTVHDEL